MTARARWYTGVGMARHAAVAVFAFGWPGQFSNAVFRPVLAYAPLWLWASAMMLTSMVMFSAWSFRNANVARVGLIMSATVTLALGTAIALGVITAWLDGVPATPLTTILLLALAAKDFAVCTQPLRSPFEDLMQSRATGRFLAPL
jgi:hypothetical protein